MLDEYTLKLRQSMILEDKIRFTKRRIEEWINNYGVDGCYVSFSGGKDSTVLLDIVREIANVEAVFVDTGLEYPEIKQFVKTKDNVTILRPKMSFLEVINEYGYPIISKEVSDAVDQGRKNLSEGKTETIRVKKLRGTLKDNHGNPSKFNRPKWGYLLDAPFKISAKCCEIMKKRPAKLYYKETGKKPIVGTMASESMVRKVRYLKTGCNAFDNIIPTSTPLAFWTEQDVLEYLYKKKIPYASVYGEIKQDENGKYYTTGCHRTGCVFCGFGCHLDKEPNRFQKLKETHPKLYDYCINGLEMSKVLDYIDVPYI